jgi:isoquinoline 1-oxidoreductase alpha subunit
MTSMTINGEAVRFRLDPSTPLLWALRDAANLTGAKYGCDSQDCGACTVIVDEQAVKSCALTIGALEGAAIVTIEGLSPDGSHPVQRAWIDEQVTQCGFCEPGLIMTIVALLRSSPRPTSEQVDGIANICRCGIGPRVRKAIARAAVTMAPVSARQTDETASSRFSNGSSGESQSPLQ